VVIEAMRADHYSQKHSADFIEEENLRSNYMQVASWDNGSLL
jgi:hypothetical protein